MRADEARAEGAEVAAFPNGHAGVDVGIGIVITEAASVPGIVYAPLHRQDRR